jgi:uncharacterized membrane protein
MREHWRYWKPNPTSGFLLIVPEDQVLRLDLSVADGIRYVISLGSIEPPHHLAAGKATGRLPEPAPGDAESAGAP